MRKTFPLWNNALLPVLFLVLAGLVAPTLLEAWEQFYAPRKLAEGRVGRGMCAAACVCVLAGGFLLRYLIVSAALPLTVAQPWC